MVAEIVHRKLLPMDVSKRLTSCLPRHERDANMMPKNAV